MPAHRGICWLLLLLWSLAGLAQAAGVEGVRLWRAPDHTRLVFDLTTPVEHQLFSLDGPDRLVIDLSDTRLQTSFAGLELGNTPIAAVRHGVRQGDDLRVVLDLSGPVRPRSFLLPKNSQYGHRLVVDLYDPEQQTVKTYQPQEQTQNWRDIVIAIDAGHGGEDPGAIGPRRVFEKDIVFAISKALAREVEGVKGYRAELIRTGDYYIPLRKRTELARRKRADLFVSIHADAFKDPRARGASVFALSRRGATSETARYLARRENQADLIGGAGSVSLADKDEMLAGVLLDLSMTATLSSSLNVGDRVLQNMGGVARLHKRQVEQAGFVVLKSPDIPSILIETGFISNPGEEKLLSKSHHQRKLARTIFQGIREHFEQAPPPGTYVAWKRNGGGGDGQEYVISRGDTLSTIARRYNVSLNDLVEFNGLSDHSIRVGQRLRIPSS